MHQNWEGEFSEPETISCLFNLVGAQESNLVATSNVAILPLREAPYCEVTNFTIHNFILTRQAVWTLLDYRRIVNIACDFQVVSFSINIY